MNNKLDILQHSLGLDQYGKGRSYRNHFCTSPGAEDSDHETCMALVANGLMRRRKGSEISGGDDIFSVTPEGITYVAVNSPSKPAKGKLA